MPHPIVKRVFRLLCQPVVFVLVLASLGALAMLGFRFYYAGRCGYWSLPWDLFLAWVPLPFAVAIDRLQPAGRSLHPATLPLAAGWLLFFPNAPYLLTQFMHLHPSYGVYDGPLPFGLGA